MQICSTLIYVDEMNSKAPLYACQFKNKNLELLVGHM